MYYMTKKHPQVSNGKIGHLINGINFSDRELRISKDSVCSGHAENTKSVLNTVFLQYHLPKSLYFPAVFLSNTIMSQKTFIHYTYHF